MRQLATIQEIAEVEPIQGADSIEKARVNGWWSVVKKGEFKPGDVVVYFEIDSFLPSGTHFDFMSKTGPKKLGVDGVGVVEGYRLQTIKLRGQISQGLIMPASILQDQVKIDEAGSEFSMADAAHVGDDVTEFLGVYKYERPMAPELQGIAKGNFPGFIPKTDEERVQNIDLRDFYNKTLVITEKMDGMSCTIYKKDGEVGVCSRNMDLKRPEGGLNAYWEAAEQINAQESIPEGYAVQGEIIGPGIQGNKYCLMQVKFLAFQVWDISAGQYMNHRQFNQFCLDRNIEMVPVITDDMTVDGWGSDEFLEFANSGSKLLPGLSREGVVVRLVDDAYVETRYGSTRASFKAISNSFLLAHGE